MLSRLPRTAALVLAVGAFAACTDSPTNASTGTLNVQLTDAPVDRVQSAVVWISRVYLIGGSDTTGGQVTISNTPTQFDLLNLQSGVTTSLGTATIPVGTYTQMRMIVDSARVTLKAPLTFVGGSAVKMLTVPSGQQTGVKVVFGAPLVITPGQTVLVADFDVARSFVMTGPIAAPTGVLFKPVIHATVTNVAASIAGTVTPANSRAQLFAVSTTSADTLASTLADSVSGAYKLRFLPPGSYTVSAVGTATGSTLNLTKAVTLRSSQDTVGVNFP
ncbi:MAG: DUF4382 domain-containing protein [Gemmatimonadetes bacterium]|nr:DUF4382 domain-containing protein [Gemmatimonadota bacterium]